MDLNIKIIEGVKQFPYLHDDNDNWDKRNKAWLQLAEKLEMPEQILKIRWYSLLQAYRRDVNFKYANRMDFVYRNAKEKVDNWPEFVINEEDLKDENSEEREEFVLLEADEEDNQTKNIKHQTSKEISNYMVKIRNNKVLKNREQYRSDERNVIENVENSGKLYAKESKNVEVSLHKPKERDITSVVTSNEEEKIETVDGNKMNENCIKKNCKDIAVQFSQPLVSDRCEDVIFGELVSAMLKSMDETKKKNIKREIMNLLFS